MVSKASATVPSDAPSRGSLSSGADGPSGHSRLLDEEQARNFQDSIKRRIFYLSEQLRVEKASRDENIVSYLKLVSKADRHRAPHVRQVFEKVNQRASATIAQIERRLRRCHQKLQELEEGRRPKGLALKAESSPHPCRRPGEKAPFSEPPRPPSGKDTDLSDVVSHSPVASHFPALQPGKSSETRCVAQQAQQRSRLLWKMKEDLREVRELHLHLQVSYQSLKESCLRDLQVSLESLQEEKCRQASMEEQVNEHVQEHLDEICRLKQNLACAEEKMAYLSYERAKEIWEVMETFKNRISKLETLQRVTQLELAGSRRVRPQEFALWFVSLLLTLATILLACTCTVGAGPGLLLGSRLRACAALMLIGLGALAWQTWCALPAVGWQAWVPSRWSPHSRESEPPADGH
ncbi:testis-specific protein TEX28 [Suricata suricatta]|uniref:testis-specific protein TEX28 n=1 Tax=Suricata suricatta TaxID=37032 RepID=UPI001155766F|nr:testis-specific protein TEX28 [Suricata suricatta]